MNARIMPIRYNAWNTDIANFSTVYATYDHE